MPVINSPQSADTIREDLWLDFFKVEADELVLNGAALNLSALNSRRKQPKQTTFVFLF